MQKTEIENLEIAKAKENDKQRILRKIFLEENATK